MTRKRTKFLPVPPTWVAWKSEENHKPEQKPPQKDVKLRYVICSHCNRRLQIIPKTLLETYVISNLRQQMPTFVCKYECPFCSEEISRGLFCAMDNIWLQEKFESEESEDDFDGFGKLLVDFTKEMIQSDLKALETGRVVREQLMLQKKLPMETSNSGTRDQV